MKKALNLFVALILVVALTVFVDLGSVSGGTLLWNTAMLAGLLFALVLLFNRLIFATAGMVVGLLGLFVADRAKFYYMDDHLRWSDLENITRHFDNLAGLNQFVTLMGKYAADAGGWLLLPIPLIGLALVWAVYWFEPGFWKTGFLAEHSAKRSLAGLVGAAAILAVAPMSANAVLKSNYGVKLTAENHRMLGTTMFFSASQTVDSGIKRTDPTFKGDQKPIQEAAKTHPPFAATTGKKPDIILWFNESTFDPNDFAKAKMEFGKWKNLEFSTFKPNANTVAYGDLDVGIFGGKSWNTVFALQGSAHVSWFHDDTYAASKLAAQVDDTLFRTLKRWNYHVDAMYGQNGYLFDAAKSQFHYGADRFFGTESFKSATNESGKADDQQLAEALKDLLAEDIDKPRVIFVFTMANHGPYPSSKFKVTPEMEKRWGKLPASVLDFLTRLEVTDKVMQDLANTVSTRKRPTIFLQIGDHKPKFPDVEFPETNKYSTYYNIQTNFKPATSAAVVKKHMDVIFLPARILELAGIPGDMLFHANRALGKACNYRLTTCPNESTDYLSSYKALMVDNFKF